MTQSTPTARKLVLRGSVMLQAARMALPSSTMSTRMTTRISRPVPPQVSVPRSALQPFSDT